MVDWKQIYYFKPQEFRCSCCGQGDKEMNHKLVVPLDRIRKQLGKPIRITSGYRCEKHNSAVGGAKHSQHRLGNACDIGIRKTDISTLFDIIALATNEPTIRGIGISRKSGRNGFIHLDCRSSGKAVWSY